MCAGNYIFIQFGDNIQTARQLRKSVFAMCANRVIYFQCLSYLELPLCIVSMRLTGLSFSFVFSFLVFEAANLCE